MAESARTYRWPYDRTPGGSMPSPETPPEEGQADLVGFTVLSLLSTAIIAVVGIAAWWVVH